MLDKFKDIFFIEKGHKYINIKTEKKLISVTTLIKKYQSEFDEDYWSKYKAKQYGVSQEEVLRNWDTKRELGLYLGSLVHNYIENYRANKLIDFTVLPTFPLTSPQLLTTELYKKRLKKQADAFLKDFEHYNLIKPELVVGNKLLAGQIDYPTKECIIDFKNDIKIKYKNKWQKFKAPLDHLDDCNYNKYCLQVSLYRYLMEEVGFRFTEKDKIIKFDRFSDTYECIEIPYLKTECKLILNDYERSSVNTAN